MPRALPQQAAYPAFITAGVMVASFVVPHSSASHRVGVGLRSALAWPLAILGQSAQVRLGSVLADYAEHLAFSPSKPIGKILAGLKPIRNCVTMLAYFNFLTRLSSVSNFICCMATLFNFNNLSLCGKLSPINKALKLSRFAKHTSCETSA